MPRFWYTYAGPQDASGYSTLGNYLYYGSPGAPACNAGNNICAVYALGDPVIIHRTGTNPQTTTPADTLIADAKADGSNQFIGTRLYLKVRSAV